ncbi:MAG TPA: hypothetical protein VFV96_17340 [Verrucomicrobiae bacterium]|nr:hypothetical protein [Verrucomicrobiae bacterium]
MKLRLTRLSRNAGSVLMVTLVTGVIIGIVLASYLVLVRHQNATVARSQAWNVALATAEAGVEEAFAQVNVGMPKYRTNGAAWAASRTIGRSQYDVNYAAFAADSAPIFYSTGRVTVPALGATLVRVVRVKTAATPLFGAALVALNDVDMKGNNISTDSYNSTNSSYVGSQGDVVSLYGLLDVGNANVHGDLLLGANNTNSLQTVTNSILKNGTVSGTIANDFNMDVAVAGLPADWNTFGAPAKPGGASAYDYVPQYDGDYTLSSLSTSLLITTNRHVRLLITGDVKLNGTPAITIEKGGSLTIYMAGQTFSMSGAGSLNTDPAAAPKDFMLVGLDGNKTISMSGNGTYTGTIYAPGSDLTLGGGGSDTIDFKGAVVVKSATMNGHVNFHFDEALPNVPIIRGYDAVAWEEL